MSATNRGSERKPCDLYETPQHVVEHFLAHHFKGEYNRILEPCCGGGNMVRELRKRYAKSIIVALDIQDVPAIEESDISRSVDYLSYTQGNYDLIFTNPPFSLAEEMITHSIKTWPKATVVMLLRTNFKGSQDRFPFWQKYPFTEEYTMSCRPTFTKRGHDNCEYSWFVWIPGATQQISKVIWGNDTKVYKSRRN